MTPEQLDEILTKVLDSNGDLSTLNDGDLTLRVRIVGDGFHKSITGEVARSLWLLQSEVYRSFALAKYGEKNIKKLTADERNALAMTFYVDEGSSLLSFDTTLLCKEFVGLLAGMDSEHLQSFLKCAAICTLLGYGLKHFFGYMSRRSADARQLASDKSRDEIDRARLQVESELIHVLSRFTNQYLRDLDNTMTEGLTNVARACPTADSVSFADRVLSSQDISRLNERARKIPASMGNEDGVFRVRGFEIVDADERVTLIDIWSNKKVRAKLSPQLKLGEENNVTRAQLFDLMTVNKDAQVFVKFCVTKTASNKEYEIISMKIT